MKSQLTYLILVLPKVSDEVKDQEHGHLGGTYSTANTQLQAARSKKEREFIAVACCL